MRDQSAFGGFKRLPARDEHEVAVSVPEVARAAIAAIEPRLTVTAAPHAEHAEVAIRVRRVRNGIHGNDEPLASGLAIVLKSELGADFGGTEIKAEVFGLGVDLFGDGPVFEAEITDGELY